MQTLIIMKLDPTLHAQLGELFAAPSGEQELTGQLLLIDVAKIHSDASPHVDETALSRLETSIRQRQEQRQGVAGTGILQPLIVRPVADGYEIVAGRRRFWAAQRVGLTQVPAIVQDLESSEDAIEQAFEENTIRQNQAPLAEAAALQSLMTARGYSVREVAQRLGKDKGYVENRLFLLKLPEDVQKMVSARADTMRHAREIAKIPVAEKRAALIEATLNGAAFPAIQQQTALLMKKRGRKPTAAKRKKAAPLKSGVALSALGKALKETQQVAQALPKGKTREAFARRLAEQAAELNEILRQLESQSG